MMSWVSLMPRAIAVSGSLRSRYGMPMSLLMTTMLPSLEWMMNNHLLMICFICFWVTMVAMPPLLNHICSMAPSFPLELLPHKLALIYPMSPHGWVIRC